MLLPCSCGAPDSPQTCGDAAAHILSVDGTLKLVASGERAACGARDHTSPAEHGAALVYRNRAHDSTPRCQGLLITLYVQADKACSGKGQNTTGKEPDLVTTHMEAHACPLPSKRLQWSIGPVGCAAKGVNRTNRKAPPPAGHRLSRRLWANLANAFRQGRCMEHCVVLLCNIT